jgi:hypothetical protein
MTDTIDATGTEEGAIAVHGGTAPLGAPSSADVQLLTQLGFIVPLASPEQLREAFAIKQRLYAAVLDENDYLYTVPHTERGKARQYLTTSRADADKVAATHGAQVNAKPMKSGVVKLARALGIVAKRSVTGGLPNDPAAQFSYVVYVAKHPATGVEEEGIGWCDKSERGGNISAHDVIATADTRAYNRAVLRLSGFGDVSGDEIVGTYGESQTMPATVTSAPVPPKAKAMKELPERGSSEVVTASRAWAEQVAQRDRDNQYVPDAQQDTRAARELRAKARRGDLVSAKKLGGAGLRWDGGASDGVGHPAFGVDEPPIGPKDILAVADAAADSAAAAERKTGMDLSSRGSDKDDEPFTAEDRAAAVAAAPSEGIPGPLPGAETITTKQAKNISILLKATFATTDEMKAWLKAQCQVSSSVNIRSNQYGPAITALRARQEGQ